MARRLIAEGAGSFYRVLTDPRDGAPLEIGRSSYRLTKAQRRFLRLRDGRCPFPGCGNHSLDNQADHLLAWAEGGTTGISNLGQPCPKHHRLKHGSAWTPTGASKDHPPGWTSPTGRHYASEHQDWEPPHWPDSFLTPDTLFGSGPPRIKHPTPNRKCLQTRSPARIPNRNCPRTLSPTGTTSRPPIHSPPQTRRARAGRRPATTPSRNAFCPNAPEPLVACHFSAVI